MRRAVITSIETGLKVPILCLPDLRERMSYKNTWCHSKQAIKEMFPAVSVDLLDDEYWFLKCLRNSPLRQELVDLCKQSQGDDFEVLKAWMLGRPGEDGIKPKGFTEVPEEFEARVLEVKNQLI